MALALILGMYFALFIFGTLGTTALSTFKYVANKVITFMNIKTYSLCGLKKVEKGKASNVN